MNQNEHLPAPSVWPFTVAGGFTLLAFGVVSSLALSVLGLLFMVVGLVGWIRELRDG